MTENILDALLFLCSNIEIAVMILGFFCSSVVIPKKRILLGTVIMMGELIAIIFVGSESVLLLVSKIISSFLIWLFFLDGSLIRRFAIYICSVSSLFFPYLCVDLISINCGYSIEELTENTYYGLLRSILTFTVVGIIAYCVRKMTIYQEAIRQIKTRYIIIAGICSFTAALLQYTVEEIVSRSGNSRLDSIVSFCVIAVSVFLYFMGIGIVIMDRLWKKYKSESILKERYLTLIKDYIEIVEENAKETRRFRHDIKSHIIILQHYVEYGGYDELKKYLNSMKENYESRIREVHSVGNKIIDALLLNSEIKSKKHGIVWKIHGSLPERFQMADYDVCTIFSNLFTNCIEACEKLTEDKRYIRFEIRTMNNTVIIELENPINNPVDVRRIGVITSKADKLNHGLGVHNIMDTVKKYNGKIAFINTKKGTFLIQIVIILS